MVNVGKYTIHGSYGNSSRSALQSANEITTASIRLDSVQTKQQSIKAKEKSEAKVTCPLNNDHLIYTRKFHLPTINFMGYVSFQAGYTKG